MNREEVGLFQQQPAARTQGLDHPINCRLGLWQMVEQPASVYEVKAAHRGAIDGDVMPDSFKVGQRYVLKQLNIDVSGDDAASWPTCSHSQAATEPPPAPTSKHRIPWRIPSMVIRRFVIGSRCSSSRESLRLAFSQELSSA
jgi:hypothetical protein